jgi:predicted nucleic acid-binding protein
MIIVDTNILLYLFLKNDRSPYAERAFRKDPGWLAPLLWRSEFRNVLAFYIRRGLISLADSIEIIELAERLMKDREYEAQSHLVLQLAVSSGCSAYDCEFVALAKDLRLPLLTADRQVLERFPESAVSLETFTHG